MDRGKNSRTLLYQIFASVDLQAKREFRYRGAKGMASPVKRRHRLASEGPGNPFWRNLPSTSFTTPPIERLELSMTSASSAITRGEERRGEYAPARGRGGFFNPLAAGRGPVDTWPGAAEKL